MNHECDDRFGPVFLASDSWHTRKNTICATLSNAFSALIRSVWCELLIENSIRKRSSLSLPPRIFNKHKKLLFHFAYFCLIFCVRWFYVFDVTLVKQTCTVSKSTHSTSNCKISLFPIPLQCIHKISLG